MSASPECDRVLYMSPYFLRWEDVSLQSPIGFDVAMAAPPSCPGCFLVFDSMAALVETYPDVDETRVQRFLVPAKP